MAPFSEIRDRLTSIPAVGKMSAEVIIAEIGTDMSRFPTPAHLASWAGMCPDNNESAGKNHSGRTTSGDPWLAGQLTECRWAARYTKDTYLASQFWQIARRRGPKRASIAVTPSWSLRGTSSRHHVSPMRSSAATSSPAASSTSSRRSDSRSASNPLLSNSGFARDLADIALVHIKVCVTPRWQNEPQGPSVNRSLALREYQGVRAY
jgi:hypothetical protein